MEVYTVPGAVAPTARRAVALGAFDGLHLGHREVIRHVLDVEDAIPTVLTFRQSPTDLPKAAPAIASGKQRRLLLQTLGIAELWEMDFEAVRAYTPQRFVQEILVDTLHATMVCCGENFRFGACGAGDVTLLRALCAACGVTVKVADTVCCDGEAISSSAIRALLQAGDMRGANRRLGSSFGLTAPVINGQHLGRKLGFPTVNQVWPKDLVLPHAGVYASCVEIDGHVHTAVSNIGMRPTVGGETPLCETHIFDFEGDLYGRELTVRPVAFLRAEQKFPSAQTLQEQVLRDRETARALFSPQGRVRAILFDFDDTLQDRPAAFLKYAMWFVNFHFPALPAEERAKRARTMWERNANGHAYVGAQPYIPYDLFFGGLIEEWGWDNAPTPAELIAESRLRFSACATLFDDTVAVLRALRERGFLLGIVTNGYSALQHHKLATAGIEPWFDVVVVGGDEGAQKPHPEPFYRAAARIGVACEDIVFVGDHPHNDLEGALAAGMQPLYIDAFDLHAAPAHIPSVRTLTEILDLPFAADRKGAKE